MLVLRRPRSAPDCVAAEAEAVSRAEEPAAEALTESDLFARFRVIENDLEQARASKKAASEAEEYMVAEQFKRWEAVLQQQLEEVKQAIDAAACGEDVGHPPEDQVQQGQEVRPNIEPVAQPSEVQVPHQTALPESGLEYQVAVPTYGRWRPTRELRRRKRTCSNCDTPFILDFTLSFLSRHAVPIERVTLFVADEPEACHYRSALRGSAWAEVKIVISVPGIRNSRNFICRHFPAGTHVVSIDDDVEGLNWKYREGTSNPLVLQQVPDGGLQRLIADAEERMRKNKAFLWGLSTSQNPRCMSCSGVSPRNGLINGYFHGFISRPDCTDLLRTISDAAEDAEFSVRNFAKDGIVLRYRMYAGITDPFVNQGGLQSKFNSEMAGSAAQTGRDGRKAEELSHALELHRLFPKLIGPPQRRAGQKTQSVNFLRISSRKKVTCNLVFFRKGSKERRRIPVSRLSKRKSERKPKLRRSFLMPSLRDDDKIMYRPNSKSMGTLSRQRYEGYMHATTVGEARRLGAYRYDFTFDWNRGLIVITELATQPSSTECKLKGDGESGTESAAVIAGKSRFVKVRILNCRSCLQLPRQTVVLLASRCPALRKVRTQTRWAALDGPLAGISLDMLRILLHWACQDVLCFAHKQAREVAAALEACGLTTLAQRAERLATPLHNFFSLAPEGHSTGRQLPRAAPEEPRAPARCASKTSGQQTNLFAFWAAATAAGR
mmetsp:Transcript_6071/g.11170  ORF Transcript_6071/g.11170 Transcript_6071/m.11170 type:complete len:721 (-) Transcript_6071:159-2321(-)